MFPDATSDNVFEFINFFMVDARVVEHYNRAMFDVVKPSFFRDEPENGSIFGSCLKHLYISIDLPILAINWP